MAILHLPLLFAIWHCHFLFVVLLNPASKIILNIGQHPFHFIYSLIIQQFDTMPSKVMTVTCNPSLQVTFKPWSIAWCRSNILGYLNFTQTRYKPTYILISNFLFCINETWNGSFQDEYTHYIVSITFPLNGRHQNTQQPKRLTK
jgi:hypothetical protein